MKEGPIFFLASDPDIIKTQLKGLPFSQTNFPSLAENVSTDAIFPTQAAKLPVEQYGEAALTGFEGITQGEIKHICPRILVVGNGFGRGSSREHAPWALQQAGIKVIVSVNGRLERIFEENCLLCGIEVYKLPEIPNSIEDFIETCANDELEKIYQDGIRPDIAKTGGLSAYNQLRLRRETEPCHIRHDEVEPNHPMTVAEKIVANHMVNVEPNQHGQKVVLPGDTGFVEANYRMSYELHAPIIAARLRTDFPNYKAFKPRDIHLFQDHSALAEGTQFAHLVELQAMIAEKYGMTLEKPARSLGQTDGICHTLALEKGLIKPGEIAVGTDSHTCTLGVLNCLSWGIGATHGVNTMITGEALIEVPQTIRVNMTGELSSNVSPKDVMLYLLSQHFVKNGSSIGTVLEFAGDGLKTWSLDQQLVLTNMAVEARAMTGIIGELTPALQEYLKTTHHISETEIAKLFTTSDPEAKFFQEISINLGLIEPMVALPGDPTYGIPLSQLDKTDIDTVYIGSCTGGNYNDLQQAARVIRGHQVSKGVKLYIQAASAEIFHKAEEEGLIADLTESGTIIVGLGCGACIGLGKGKADNDKVTVSTTNRNFKGRMGGEGPVYLSSPETAAQAAIQGYIGMK